MNSSPFAHSFDALVLEVFRLNGALIARGDELTAPLRLTSARWQVLGALASLGTGTVADLAREMGLTRQSVQRIVGELGGARLVELVDNPRHRRARLVQFTPAGAQAFEAANAAWRPLADALAEAVGPLGLETARRTLLTARETLDHLSKEDPQ